MTFAASGIASRAGRQNPISRKFQTVFGHGVLDRFVPNDDIGQVSRQLVEILLLHPEARHFLDAHPDPARFQEGFVVGKSLVVSDDVVLLQTPGDDLPRAEGLDPDEHLVRFGEPVGRVSLDGDAFVFERPGERLRVGFHLALELGLEFVHFVGRPGAARGACRDDGSTSSPERRALGYPAIGCAAGCPWGNSRR